MTFDRWTLRLRHVFALLILVGICAVMGTAGTILFMSIGIAISDGFHFVMEAWRTNQLHSPAVQVLGAMGVVLGVWLGGGLSYWLLLKAELVTREELAPSPETKPLEWSDSLLGRAVARLLARLRGDR